MFNNENEIVLDANKEILSATDKKGNIVYTNDYFNEISGYSDEELIGSPHNIIRHPDMPRAVFKLMWDSLLKDKKNFRGVIKNKAKNGDFYWVITDFTFEDIDGNPVFFAKRTLPNEQLLKKIKFIYKRMLEIEKEHPKNVQMEYSLKFLNDIIHSSGLEDYDSFINFLTEEK